MIPSAELVRYNAQRCESAKQPLCRCHCGGKLHGKKHSERWIRETVEQLTGGTMSQKTEIARDIALANRWKRLPFYDQVERAHRQALRELETLIPWAPPEVARELRKRYKLAYRAATMYPEQLDVLLRAAQRDAEEAAEKLLATERAAR